MSPLSTPSALPPHRTVRVELGPRAYDVLIGRGLLERLGVLLKERDLSGPVALIVDGQVSRLFASPVQGRLNEAGLDNFLIDIPSGEPSKSMAEVVRLLSGLAQKKVPRSGTVLALGGGVIGDVAGFVAASYLRGVAFVQIPTTLLAMVDSSVGGKTGVNLPEGKNLVGAFHQPRLVVADLDTLTTLPPREFAAGMAEVIKYGAIADRALFDRVAKGVKPEDEDLAEIIETCVAIKARIVENDEFETKGQRALLNFGHTIGHAVEKATGYRRYLHGEAVALGMRAAARLSVAQAGLPEADARQIEAALAANGLLTELDPQVDKEAVFSALGNDKKVAVDGRNRWVLLPGLGKAACGYQIVQAAVQEGVHQLYSSK